MELTIEALQKPSLPGTARIIQKVLDMELKNNEAAVPKTTGWCPLCYCDIFNNDDDDDDDDDDNNNNNSNINN